MAEQQFNPGVSLAGAVDLEALKHQVKAEPGQAGGAPAAGGYVIDTTENTFQAMVQTSATFPILLLLWVCKYWKRNNVTEQMVEKAVCYTPLKNRLPAIIGRLCSPMTGGTFPDGRCSEPPILE